MSPFGSSTWLIAEIACFLLANGEEELTPFVFFMDGENGSDECDFIV